MAGSLEKVQVFIHEKINRLRDRRRTTRRRLEKIFGRKTFTSVAVLGAMGKLIETTIVPFLDPSSAVELGRVSAWVSVFIVAILVSVYWERVADTAENVAEAAEETTDPDSN